MNKPKPYKSKVIESILQEVDPRLENRIEVRMKLASKIESAREKLGWSKKEMAEKFSKQPSEITKWLSGTHNFTIDTLVEIQDVLGIELINLGEKSIEQSLFFSLVVSQPDLSKYIPYEFQKRPNAVGLYKQSFDIDNMIPVVESGNIIAQA